MVIASSSSCGKTSPAVGNPPSSKGTSISSPGKKSLSSSLSCAECSLDEELDEIDSTDSPGVAGYRDSGSAVAHTSPRNRIIAHHMTSHRASAETAVCNGLIQNSGTTDEIVLMFRVWVC
jgi:hypothetical protein